MCSTCVHVVFTVVKGARLPGRGPSAWTFHSITQGSLNSNNSETTETKTTLDGGVG